MELNSQLSLLALSYVSGDSMEDDIMKVKTKKIPYVEISATFVNGEKVFSSEK